MSKAKTVLFSIFVAITALAVFVPFKPRMPGAGLDASWEFAMNEAVARHLSFGTEVIFTYGPYASIGTRTYSPATDLRMMLGSIQLGASYLLALKFLASGKRRLLIIALLLFLAVLGSTELLLLSYSFLLVACTVKHLNARTRGQTETVGWGRHAAGFVMWSTLGLLPLIKGSLLLPFAASIATSCVMLGIHSRFMQSLSSLVLPIAAALAYWTLAGQPLSTLPAFLHGTIRLTAGYTEAMSTAWVVVPLAVGYLLVTGYIAISILACHSITRGLQMDRSSKCMLVLLCALLLFVTFKHAFVAVANAPSVFATISVFIFIIAFLAVDRHIIWLLSVAVLISACGSLTKEPLLLQEVHERFGVGAVWGRADRQADVVAFCANRALGAFSRATVGRAVNAYADVWRGLYLRMSRTDDLVAELVKAKSRIRQGDPLPLLKGTTDFYEFDQSAILASDNQWNPRPIIQSYSAYTPQLAKQNEDHLRGRESPDWVFFRLQSIDERLPSIDDGASWSALIDNYTVASLQNGLATLKKRDSTRGASSYESISEKLCVTGATVTVPETRGLIFAEVDLQPTWAGRLLISLFSPPQLRITLGLRSGETKSYRVVSEMMESGFLLSPLVSNTGEFAGLWAPAIELADRNQVQTISIAPSYGGDMFWSRTYELTLKEYSVK